jgi:hypothetical protein
MGVREGSMSTNSTLLVPPAPPWSAAAGARTLLLATVAIVLAASTVMRIAVGAGEPLWLDEAWTGVHSLQPTFADFVREVYVDINAPLYYVVMWAWSAAFGVSNEALRLPSVLFGLLCPALALLPSREIGWRTRLVWCGLLATWVPGLMQSQEARCYALLLALATGGTILHARLLAAPSLARAAAWAGIGALAILTHYYAAILFGCQGLAYLARHRGTALRTWPAALLFVPAFGWTAYHLPQLATFAQATWYATLSASALPWLLLYATGPAPLVMIVLGAGVPGTLFGVPLPSFRTGRERAAAVLPWVVGAAAVGALILVGAGFLRPSFTARYLTIFVPGLLLAIAAWVAAIGSRRAWVPPVALGLALAWATFWAVSVGSGWARSMNFQTASEHLAEAGAGTVIFTWDNPSTRTLAPRHMAELGSFFFRRAGGATRTVGLALQAGDDPNRRLLEAAAGQPNAAILWIYDLAVPGTAAIAHPPAIAEREPGWTCRDFGRPPTGVVACLSGR